MATGVSNVSIGNRALQLLKQTRISSFTQAAPGARALLTAYDPVRLAELRKHPWSFAKQRASRAADAEQTADSENRFLVPNDFVRLLRPVDRRVDWTIEGRYIITLDSAPLEFTYIKDVTEPTLFDPLFCEALAHALAIAMCQDLTGSSSQRRDLRGAYADVIADARKANAFELDPVVPVEDDYILAML